METAPVRGRAFEHISDRGGWGGGRANDLRFALTWPKPDCGDVRLASADFLVLLILLQTSGLLRLWAFLEQYQNCTLTVAQY